MVTLSNLYKEFKSRKCLEGMTSLMVLCMRVSSILTISSKVNLFSYSKVMVYYTSQAERYFTADVGKETNSTGLEYWTTSKTINHLTLTTSKSTTTISISTITIYGHNMKASFIKIKSMDLGRCILLMGINLVGVLLMTLFKGLATFIGRDIIRL